MLLIIGLGNPSNKYKLNLHNVGFMALDYIASNLNFEGFSSNFSAEVSSGNINNHKVMLLKPTTFMNLSGNSVSAIVNFYKITLDNIIVIHDDIDLLKGDIRYRFNSGHGGHNGIRDIQAKIGSNFHRIKIGVGRPDPQMDVSDYVLSNFSKQDLNTWLPKLFESMVTNFNYILNKQFDKFIELTN